MEFGEKLQELRKHAGLTQEELAQALYVSRTAVSKWESGRGYPSIDSLKEISGYFSVTIDDLLSGEKLLSIAQRENQANIRNMCEMLLGMTDLFALLLIILPLYPKSVEGYVYAVNLLAYTDAALLNRVAYGAMAATLALLGVFKLLPWRQQSAVTRASVALGIAAVLVLAMAGETYAVTVAFLLLLCKGMLLFKRIKAGG